MVLTQKMNASSKTTTTKIVLRMIVIKLHNMLYLSFKSFRFFLPFIQSLIFFLKKKCVKNFWKVFVIIIWNEPVIQNFAWLLFSSSISSFRDENCIRKTKFSIKSDFFRNRKKIDPVQQEKKFNMDIFSYFIG